jgi:hypothetical protein
MTQINIVTRSLVSRKGGREQISVSHVVSSETDDLDKIREIVDCVHLPSDLLKKYYTDNPQFTVFKYSVEI